MVRAMFITKNQNENQANKQKIKSCKVLFIYVNYFLEINSQTQNCLVRMKHLAGFWYSLNQVCVVVQNRYLFELAQVEGSLLKGHGSQAGCKQNNVRILSSQWPFSLVLPVTRLHHQLNLSLLQHYPNSQAIGNMDRVVSACSPSFFGQGVS